LLPAARENGTLVISDSAIRLPLANGATAVPPTFLLGVRPEDVRIDPAGDLRGEVILTEPLGVETVVHIRSGGRRSCASCGTIRTWQSATRSPSRSTGAGCIFFERAASASRIEVDWNRTGHARSMELVLRLNKF